MVGQARPAQGVQAGVALHRRRKVGRYEPEDIERFAVLHRHLERALAIGFRLGSLGAMQQCCAELLDFNPTAILMLDERKRLVFANRAAQVLESSGDGFGLSADGVTLTRRQDNERLRALIGQALSAETGSAGGTMRAGQPPGKRPYGIAVCPVSRRHPGLAALRPGVCIVIADPDRQTPLAGQRLEAAFGLTPAEARLAELLAAGEKLQSAAEQLKITYGTARARLAVIFQKTDTRRQGELVRLLLTTLAAV
jgi:DNA-binding CsgD family transcriptional regulator